MIGAEHVLAVGQKPPDWVARRMSTLGENATCALVEAMCALTLTRDIDQSAFDVSFVPKGDIGED